MNSLSLLDPSFIRNTIGFARDFDRVAKHFIPTVEKDHFPPYNIIKNSDTSVTIKIAVAGYTRSELNISVTPENNLLIEGEKTPVDEQQKPEYLYRGIAGRAFTRKFAMVKDAFVSSATMDNGILTITVDLPEIKQQTNTIEIK